MANKLVSCQYHIISPCPHSPLLLFLGTRDSLSLGHHGSDWRSPTSCLLPPSLLQSSQITVSHYLQGICSSLPSCLSLSCGLVLKVPLKCEFLHILLQMKSDLLETVKCSPEEIQSSPPSKISEPGSGDWGRDNDALFSECTTCS